MMSVISPAKKLDFETPAPVNTVTEGRFNQDAAELVDVLRTCTVGDLQGLMSLSESLASLNVDRFSRWQLPMDPAQSKQAMYAFVGDVYQGLEATTLTPLQVERAQAQLRILSGLYGLLRPLDRILPYRLEMGTRLSNARGRTLYDWWGDSLTSALANDVRKSGAKTLVNLASNEYFKAVRPKQLPVPVVTPEFRDLKNGQYKIISFYAKKARGLMVRYMLEHDVDSVEDLKAFNWAGYRFDAERSTTDRWQFLRDEVPEGS
nr:peroxide stress protein YaaA [Saccharospirillum impatiens]